MAAVENGIKEISNGLIGNATTPGVYEQVRSISTTVNQINSKFDEQQTTITNAVESYKGNVWYIRGLVAAVTICAGAAGWLIKFFLDLR